MEGLRQLEIENQRLQKRIQELENAKQSYPREQPAKKNVQQSPNTIDLRTLALEPPKDNAQECLRLMGIALGNLASAMNNTKALQAAALVLGTEPTPQAIAYRAEQLQLLPQAVNEIRQVLSKPGCTWHDYLAVGPRVRGDQARHQSRIDTAGNRVNQYFGESRILQDYGTNVFSRNPCRVWFF